MMAKKTKNLSKDLQQELALPLALEDGKELRVQKAVIFVLASLAGAILIWGSLAQIREKTVANGRVKPFGSVHIVRHPEGGVVDKIFAANGTMVKKGDPLLALRPVVAELDIAQTKARMDGLAIQAHRIDSLLTDKTPDFTQFSKDYYDLIGGQADLYRNTKATHLSRMKAHKLAIEQKQEEVAILAQRVASAKRRLDIMQTSLELKKTALDKGVISRNAFLTASEELEVAKGSHLSLASELAAAQNAVQDLKLTRDTYITEYRQTLLTERSQIQTELDQLDPTINKQSDRVAQLVVRSPSNGVVNALAINIAGEVVDPRAPIAEIVPTDSNLVAEVEVHPKDVAHVIVGAEADVKLSAYDAIRYGAIKGEVQSISANSFERPDGSHFFKAEIALASDLVGLTGQKMTVRPGMELTSEIVTGSKSPMRYFLKPIFRAQDLAFSER